VLTRLVHLKSFSLVSLALVVAVALALVLAGPATAQLGPAMAGRTAAAQNAATVNQNPAGLMRLDAFEVVLDGMVAVSDNKFDVKSGTTETGGNPSNEPEIAGIPQFAVSTPIGDRFAVGFGFSIPTGFGSDYGKDWAGRYLAQESTLVFMSAQPVVAVRITDWLSLGAGAAIMYSISDTKVAVNNGPGLDDGRMQLDVDGISAGAVVSTLIEPLPNLRLGASWRSEIKPDLDGRAKFKDLSPATEALLDAAGLLDAKIELGMRIPQSVGVGFYYEPIPDLGLMADFTWIDWSRFGKLDLSIRDTAAGNVSTTLKLNYRDIYIGSIGAEYRFSPRWKAGVGFSYVSSGVADKDRSLALPLDEFYASGIGFTTQISESVELSTNFLVVIGGKAPVDQPSRQTQRVVGEFERRQSFVLQLSMVWQP
jgi:long-chain fatty acid transport protein